MSSKVAGNIRDKAMMIRLITSIIDNDAQREDTRTQSTTVQDVDAQEVDSLLVSVGLSFISANTLPRFIERSAGNRLTVKADDVVYTFTQVPANER